MNYLILICILIHGLIFSVQTHEFVNSDPFINNSKNTIEEEQEAEVYCIQNNEEQSLLSIVNCIVDTIPDADSGFPFNAPSNSEIEAFLDITRRMYNTSQKSIYNEEEETNHNNMESQINSSSSSSPHDDDDDNTLKCPSLDQYSVLSNYVMYNFNNTYCILLEKTKEIQHGFGTVITRQRPISTVSPPLSSSLSSNSWTIKDQHIFISVPHPGFDYQTASQGTIMLTASPQVRAMHIAGVNRYANRNVSSCQPSYRIWDAAHNDRIMLYELSRDLFHYYYNHYHYDSNSISKNDYSKNDDNNNNNLKLFSGKNSNSNLNLNLNQYQYQYQLPSSNRFVVFQLHGMADDSCPGIDGYFTAGTRYTDHPSEYETPVILQQLINATISIRPEWRVKQPADDGGDPCRLAGSNNVMGRKLNSLYYEYYDHEYYDAHYRQQKHRSRSQEEGLFNPCESSWDQPSGLFLHLEQVKSMRLDHAAWESIMEEMFSHHSVTSDSDSSSSDGNQHSGEMSKAASFFSNLKCFEWFYLLSFICIFMLLN